ncbi:MAG: glycosyltransferase family 4 protein [Candidatus Poseidoniaceae archaeon]|nr:glycosyltransferase family 4 protein [Candidatus Poseidoniaceae archaeon]
MAIVSGEYPPRWGGIGSVVFHLAGHLVKLGHEVTIITRNHKINPPSQEGVEVLSVKWAPLPMAFTRSYGKKSIKALKKLHSRKPIDVIHAHLPLVSWKRSEYQRLQKDIAPIVSCLHGSWIGEKEGVKRAAKAKESATWRNPNDLAILTTAGWYSRYERAGILESTICVANSQSTLKEFNKWYNPDSNFDCEVVLWGCDHRVFRPQNIDDESEQLEHERIRTEYGCGDEEALNYSPNTKTPMLLAVGRLVARKGYMTLLRAMPKILEENAGTKLVIVGRGHMRKSLESNAKKLGISHAITVKSSLSFDELAQYFRSADLVVYPSYYEGQGLIPLESLASGTPVVTVNQEPLTEMIDNTVGALFERGDSVDLAAKVNDMLSSTDRLEKAKLGRERVLSNYTYEHNALSFEKIFNRAIEKHQDFKKV